MISGFRRREALAFLGAASVAAALVSVTLTTANASTTFVKNGSYQFASNYTDGSATPFVVSNSTLGYADASQHLGANGVDLSAGPSSYASSAVIVPLGRLSTLFNSSGVYVPPKIAGSSNLLLNLYFDTNGNGTYFGWGTHDPYFFVSEDGDSAASMEVPGSADFTTFAGEPGNGNSSVPVAGVMPMPTVRAAYANRTDGGVKDPLVWAWIGIQTNSAATTGFVTSVDGTPLVRAVPQPPSKLTGHAVCGVRASRHWVVSDYTGGRDRTFKYYISRGKVYAFQGAKTVTAGHSVGVVTHNGNNLKVTYFDGYGHFEALYVQHNNTPC